MLGIASAKIAADGTFPEENYELTTLLDRALTRFDDVVLISYEHLALEAISGRVIRIRSRLRDLTEELCALIARGTGSHGDAAHALAVAAESNGIVLLDSASRFAGSSPGKTISTLLRHRSGVGMPSALVFGPPDVDEIMRLVASWPRVIVKPIRGSQGRGIEVFDDHARLVRHLQETSVSSTEPLLLQELRPIAEEWRVMLLWGQEIGVAAKIIEPGVLTANAATGATFVAPTDSVDEVREFAKSNAPAQGLVGMDVARDETGELFVIEANFSPNWQTFDGALGVDTAQVIVDALAQRVTELRR